MPAARPARALTMSAALVATVLTAAACTATPPASVPTTLPTAAPTSIAPTPSPTPTEDPNPAGLKPLPADEIDASFVTIENFFRAYEYGLRTGDSSILSTLSAKDCTKCTALRENIDKLKERSARASGGEFTMTRADFLESNVPGRHAWRLTLRQSDTKIVEEDGTKSTAAGGEGLVLVEVATGSPYTITAFDANPDE